MAKYAPMTKTPAALLALLLAPLAAAAAPDPAFDPLAFLAGHCWKGPMPDGKSTDEHFFSWIYEGKYLRDRHVVKAGDKTVYEGETIYFWNGAERRLEYFYITASGGHSLGRVSPEADAIAFPVATLVTAGRNFNFRSRIKRVGDNAYEVLREYETDKGWMPVKMEMTKVR
jgi:hypothetical protein